MIERIIENVFLIKVPLPGSPLKNLNSYFIKGQDRNLLIDTGFNSQVCYDALIGAMDALKSNMDNTDIFLTHLHTDHVGLCNKIASKDTKIFISSTDESYLKALYQQDYLDNLFQRYYTLGFSVEELEENIKNNPMVKYLPPKDTLFTAIEDSYEFDLGTFKLKGVVTPGHTPGHMCLYSEDTGILFSGDHIIFDITPNITIWKDVENSLDDYIKSLKKIKSYEVKTTLSAHRKAMGNCYDRIDELIAHHNNRLEEAYDIVKNSGGITPYHAASKMKWSIKAKDWSEFPVIQKWFAVSEATAHLDYLVAGGFMEKELRSEQYYYYVNNKSPLELL
jgi:glyoxylase-like metal-dependent hydrolase (beta-lactamase superfamily II)